MLKQRKDLLSHLKKSISEVHSNSIPSAKHPIAYIECPLSYKEGCMPHVRLEDISESERVHCSKNNGKIVPPSAYMMLLQADHGE